MKFVKKDYFFITIFLILIAALFVAVSPILDGIIMGITLYYAARPVYRFLSKKVKRKNMSALLTSILFIFPIFFMVFLLLFYSVDQIIKILSNPSKYSETFLELLKRWNVHESIVESIRLNIPSYMNSIAQLVISKLITWKNAVSLTLIFLNLIIASLAVYYLLIKDNEIAKVLTTFFKKYKLEEWNAIIAEVDNCLETLWFGNFTFSIWIGILSYFFFRIFNTPFLELSSFFMFLSALIPIIAEWMVIIPLAIYYFSIKGLYFGILFFVSSLVILYIIPELIIRPIYLEKKTKINAFLLLISFIGGGLSFGIKGFFLFPSIAAILYALYDHIRKTL